jgi:hypothetical protein
MFNSAVLDVAAGIIFTFLTVSLICGLLTEVWATVMSWRANTLLAGVQSLVNDPKFDGLAQALYQHALVHPLGDATAGPPGALTGKPSYIDPVHFAGAMIDTLNIAGSTAAEMKTAIAASPLIAGDNQMTTMLNGMADRAGGDLEKLRGSIAAWFDAGMDRVSGSYKRWTQIYCFGFGLLVAVVLNIDTLRVSRALWQQPQITHALAASVTPADALTSVRTLQTLDLPIGWTVSGSQCPKNLLGWLAKLLGWTITAFSTLFGASFWFDALSGLLKLRGSGPSPDRSTS